MKVLGIKSAAVAQFQSWKVVENESEDKSTYGYTMKLAHNTVKSNQAQAEDRHITTPNPEQEAKLKQEKDQKAQTLIEK